MPEQRDEIAAELEVDPCTCRIHVEGWQSWTPTTCYRLGDRQWLPVRPETWTSCYAGSRPRPPRDSFQGDGLVVVDPGTGADIVAVGALNAEDEIPLVRCQRRGNRRLLVHVNGPASIARTTASLGMEAAKSAFAEAFATASGLAQLRRSPTIWCSWYGYYRSVTEADIDENLEAIAERALPVEVIQLDDGYQREIGDWLVTSHQFRSLPAIVERIRNRGHRAGIWTSPFLVGSESTAAAEHPEWLLRSDSGAPVIAVHNWGQDTYALDVTHPGVKEYLSAVFGRFVAIGIDFFKLDFLYAAALDGRRHDPSLTSTQAYRCGLAHVRSVVGSDAYLLGCGAPLLPSVGMVDAMRVSADTSPQWAAFERDMSQPGGESAELSVRARAYQHGRYWVNDPDCMLLTPDVEHRQRRARMIRQYGGLRGLSGRVAELDVWGLAAAHDLLTNAPSPTPFR